MIIFNIMVVRITALNWRFNNRKYDQNIIAILSSSGTKVTCLDSGDLKKGTSEVTCTTGFQPV